MIVWSEAYNVYTTELGGVLELTVAWNAMDPKGSPHGYRVSVGGRRLKGLFSTVDEGKAAALQVAKQLAHQIIAQVNGTVKP